MPGWLKVILIIVLILIALLVGAGFIGYHWIKTHAPELKAQGEKVRADAVAFGTGKTPEACVDEAFARLSRCDGIVCEAMTKIFLTRCVAASNVPEGFCASIPRHTEFIASAKWAMGECARRAHSGDQRCTRVIAGLQDYCERR
jgi:hypothetical protein